MDELKRWRDERTLRHSLRILRDFQDEEEFEGRLARRSPRRRRVPKKIDLGSRAARGIRWVSITPEARDTVTLREAEALRNLGPISKSLVEANPAGGFRIWPRPPRVSPVHPEWDDPTGGRFKWSFYRSMVVHLVLIPGVLLLSRVNFTLDPPPFRPGAGSFQLVAVVTGPPPGSGGTRREAPPAPKVEEKKVEAAKPKPKPSTPKTPAKTPPSERRTVKKPEFTKPVAVKDRDAPKEDRNDSRARTNEKTPEEREPVTDPVAEEGEDFALAGPAGPGSSPGSYTSMGVGGGVDFPYNYYLETIRSGIAKVWQVPQGLVSKGRRLNAVVRFRINRDGTISEAAVEEPSGFSFFDQAALRAISQVRKFPPLPQEFGGRFLLVHFQFTYTGQ